MTRPDPVKISDLRRGELPILSRNNWHTSFAKVCWPSGSWPY